MYPCTHNPYQLLTGVKPSKPLPAPKAPLLAKDGKCNIGMPSNTFDRFLWVINYFVKAGFVVVIDNHVWLEDPTAYENPSLWVDSWVNLVKAINKVSALVLSILESSVVVFSLHLHCFFS